MAMFDGTPGNDQYFGTAQPDEIGGNDGQDQLRGGSGNDTIRGGNGPDSLYGDRDDDEIHGGSGGHAEGDILLGIEGVIGSAGNDHLDAADNGSIDGLQGGAGNDTLRGGGSGGLDHLDGGIGDDHLVALTHGELVGGPGDDTFELAGGEFSGGEIVDFTKGEDTIELAFSNAEVSASDLSSLLRNSTGNVLDLSLLGAGFEDFGELVLNVPVSTLDASDFVIS